MSPQDPFDLLKPDPESYLDALSPEDYVRELPDHVEPLAMEFEQVKLRISTDKLDLVADVIDRGMKIRQSTTQVGETPFPMKLKSISIAGYKSVQLIFPRAEALTFVADLRRGMPYLTDKKK
jgi:hypothetical protein